MNARQIRIVAGALIWLFIIGWVGFRYAPGWFGEESAAGQSLTTFLTESSETRELKFKYSSNVRIGDPVFYKNEEGDLVQVGALRQVDSPESQNYEVTYCDWASVTFFSSAPALGPGDYLTLHQTPTSMDWVARFLFPPDRQAYIIRLIAEVYATHSEEVLSELMPILQSAWTETSVIIRDEVLESLARHRPEFEGLASRYRTEIVEGELIPLVGEEVWPIVRAEAQPVLEQVGEEIWKQASVFRFGWRALYDASPLPRRDLTHAEFARFVEDEAVPVLSRNLPLFMETQQAILQQIISNPKVQDVAKASLRKIGEDPELQGILLTVLRESILENEKLQEALLRTWNRPDLKEVMALTDQRLEPTVVQIGEEVFGSPYAGVTPEFARILRNKILLKDERWLILHKAENGIEVDPLVVENKNNDTLVVLEGSSNMENPFYYPARPR